MPSTAAGIVAVRNNRRKRAAAAQRNSLRTSQQRQQNTRQREHQRRHRSGSDTPRHTRRSSGGVTTLAASGASINDGNFSAVASGGGEAGHLQVHCRKDGDDTSSHEQIIVSAFPVDCGDEMAGDVGQGGGDGRAVGRDDVGQGGEGDSRSMDGDRGCGDSANDEGKDSIRRFLRRLKNGRNLCGRIVNNQRLQSFVVP